ncbi:MAG: hypothetical protein HC886_21700 [Leptolyngbyaceae cyanobacterium SM1_1_3]|nr:hypothetical protein [Leptolyngbyaceae cyanobacterium SM1_1_3]
MRVNYLSALAMASILSVSLVATGCSSESSAPADSGDITEQADPVLLIPRAAADPRADASTATSC